MYALLWSLVPVSTPMPSKQTPPASAQGVDWASLTSPSLSQPIASTPATSLETALSAVSQTSMEADGEQERNWLKQVEAVL